MVGPPAQTDCDIKKKCVETEEHYGQSHCGSTCYIPRMLEEKWAKIEADTDKLAKKSLAQQSDVTPSWKVRAVFTVLHFVQRKGWNDADAVYWKQMGWTGSKRPWKE